MKSGKVEMDKLSSQKFSNSNNASNSEKDAILNVATHPCFEWFYSVTTNQVELYFIKLMAYFQEFTSLLLLVVLA